MKLEQILSVYFFSGEIDFLLLALGSITVVVTAGGRWLPTDNFDPKGDIG